jgi:hypothetical protein
LKRDDALGERADIGPGIFLVQCLMNVGNGSEQQSGQWSSNLLDDTEQAQDAEARRSGCQYDEKR